MYRNPSALLALDREPAARLLRATGIQEDIIRNGSDYARFEALAAAMPLCRGHDLAAAMLASLREATGLALPLCPATAPVYWQAWTDIHWYGIEPCVAAAAAASVADCPPPPLPAAVEVDATRLPDLSLAGTDACPADLPTYEACLRSAMPSAGGYARFSLPPSFGFRRPDPYHAARSLQACAQGRATEAEGDVLRAQALRVLGETAKARGVTLLLCGGAPAAVRALLDYLHAVDRLPRAVWVPDDPRDATHISGLYPQVGTGFAIRRTDTPAEQADRRAAYAQGAPIGCAVQIIQ